MAWTNPRTWVAGEMVTDVILNTHIRDNFNETAPAKVTTAGDIVYATAANTLARLAIGAAGNVLMVVGGAPAWKSNVVGMLNTGWAIPRIQTATLSVNSGAGLADGAVYSVTWTFDTPHPTGNIPFVLATPRFSNTSNASVFVWIVNITETNVTFRVKSVFHDVEQPLPVVTIYALALGSMNTP